jgi:hypothetical protein
VAATSTQGSVGRQWRFSVRLDHGRALFLKRLSDEAGCPPSELVRRLLDQYTASKSPAPAAPKRANLNVATVSLRQLPITNGESPKAASPAIPELRPTAPLKAVTSTQPTQAVEVSSSQPCVAEFVAQYRAFGGEIWSERRRLFQRLLAAAKVAQSNNENPKDAELHRELIALGMKYGLLN